VGIVAAIVLLRGQEPPLPAASGPPAALTVTTATLTPRELRTTISGLGTVVAWQELTVAAEATGLKVTELLVDEGDVVTAGQVLARLDNRVVAAQLRAQEARVAEARAAVTVAENALKRAQELVARGVISAATLEDRTSASQTAAARLTAAAATRDELATRLTQTNIIAPAAGRISSRTILIGDVVSPGAEAFRLIRDDRLELDAQLPETVLGGIAPGQGVRVIHESVSPIAAEVRAIAPTVDPKSRLGVVHIALPVDSGLRVGMYARAEITLAEKALPALPESAIVWREDKPIVFVVNPDGLIAEREVVIGTRQDGWVEIRDGLAATQPVVSVGAGFLHDGDRVRVTQPAPGAPAAGT
jgi:RND family efflux transporter MFP subunit